MPWSSVTSSPSTLCVEGSGRGDVGTAKPLNAALSAKMDLLFVGLGHGRDRRVHLRRRYDACWGRAQPFGRANRCKPRPGRRERSGSVGSQASSYACLSRPRRHHADAAPGRRRGQCCAGPGGQPVVAARLGSSGPAHGRGVARGTGRRGRRAPVRGDLHRRRYRVGQPRGQGHLLGPPRRGSATAADRRQPGRAPRRTGHRRVAGRSRGRRDHLGRGGRRRRRHPGRPPRRDRRRSRIRWP